MTAEGTATCEACGTQELMPWPSPMVQMGIDAHHALIRALEEERDMYKGTFEAIKKVLDGPIGDPAIFEEFRRLIRAALAKGKGGT
ncbi:MAG: hypothetical protein L3K18_09640 [Thermoplasmata archaeon]|nr:hypothetical protein [Thermoplasmata archaeon]